MLKILYTNNPTIHDVHKIELMKTNTYGTCETKINHATIFINLLREIIKRF